MHKLSKENYTHEEVEQILGLQKKYYTAVIMDLVNTAINIAHEQHLEEYMIRELNLVLDRHIEKSPSKHDN